MLAVPEKTDGWWGYVCEKGGSFSVFLHNYAKCRSFYTRFFLKNHGFAIL